MTTKDDTGDKLAASIRRTKAGGAAKKGDEAGAAPRRKSPSRGAKTADKLPAVTRRAASRDTYESRGRIWPD